MNNNVQNLKILRHCLVVQNLYFLLFIQKLKLSFLQLNQHFKMSFTYDLQYFIIIFVIKHIKYMFVLNNILKYCTCLLCCLNYILKLYLTFMKYTKVKFTFS